MGDYPCKEENIPQEITDGCRNRNPPERCAYTLYSLDSMHEHHEIPQDNQGESLSDVKAEDTETEVKGGKLCKDEEVTLETCTDFRTAGWMKTIDTMASQLAFTSQEGTSNTDTPETCPSPRDSTEGNHNLQGYPADGLNDIKVEVKEEAEVISMIGDYRCKEEVVPPKINTDRCWNRNPPERSPYTHYSRHSTQEHHEFSQDNQSGSLIDVKAEGQDDMETEVNGGILFKEEEHHEILQDNQGERLIDVKAEEQDDPETEVNGGNLCKDEEMPPEICTGPHCSNRGKWDMSPCHEVEDSDITTRSSEESSDPHYLQPVKKKGRKTAYCSECDKWFPHKSQFIEHQRIHTGEKPYLCEECGRCFTRRRQRDQHRRTHSGEKPFRCSICGKHLAHKSSLIKHQRLHTEDKPYACSECDKSFVTKSILSEHLRTHTGLQPFPCPKCEKSFSTRSILVIHQRVHLDKKPFPCPKCSKSFTSKANLLGHLTTHTDEKPFSCPACKKSFTSRYNLVLHEKIHLGDKPYSCTECGKSFIQRACLVLHRRTHTGEKPYSCSKCGKSFACKSNLARHEKRHKYEPYVCSDCGKCFSQMSHLITHQSFH